MDFIGVLDALNNGGLQNPIYKAIETSLIDFSIPTQNDINNAAMTQAGASGLPVPAAPVLESMRIAMVDASNSIYSLVSHTNILSGVDLTGAINIATIAKTVASAKSINGEPSCSSVHAAFGSLHKAEEMIAETLKVIVIIKEALADIPRNATSVVSSLEQYTTKIVSQIASDVDSRVKAELDNVKNSVARNVTHLLDDDCLKTIADAIMTPQMRNEVDKVRLKLIQKVLIV